MRKLFVLILLGFCLGTSFTKASADTPPGFGAMQALDRDDLGMDTQPFGWKDASRDTVNFGYYETREDGLTYAVLGETWTFDHGAADPLEGWTPLAAVKQPDWEIGFKNPALPITGGWIVVKMAVFRVGSTSTDTLKVRVHIDAGSTAVQKATAICNAINADSSCSDRVKATQPSGSYGAGLAPRDIIQAIHPEKDKIDNITVDDSLDECTVKLNGQPPAKKQSATGKLKLVGFGGSGYATCAVEMPGWTKVTCSVPMTGLPGDVVEQELATALHSRGVPAHWSGDLVVDIGPVEEWESAGITADFSSFDPGFGEGSGTSLEATPAPSMETWFGVGERSNYIITAPCSCALAGYVMKFHDDTLLHPPGQHEIVCSPIIDRKTDLGDPGYREYNRILAEWDQYSDLPMESGVFYRTGWSYYPYEDPQTPGLVGWSPRVGIETFYYGGEAPTCGLHRSIGTDRGLPGYAERVKFLYEVYASGDAFGITRGSEVTNFSPLIDNITVRNVNYVNAPVALFEPGTRFQDGFGRDALGVVSTTDPGNANIAWDLRQRLLVPTLLGDSLVVKGPEPLSSLPDSKWEARLWFRLKRMGPGQDGNATFNQWKLAVASAKGDFYTGAQPNFAWGYMDSVEALSASGSQFCSLFRENDPNFNWGGGGEKSPGNAILPDGAFTPGTKIEYFVTTNYVPTPNVRCYCPDTTGNTYLEFEILPSFRTSGGVDRFPCVLYVDALNRGAQPYIENALNVVLNGAGPGAPVPDPTSWDRYDYLDASSNWNGPLYRVNGGNSGATILQLLGYKLIMISLGDAGPGTMEPRDWQGIQQWLEATVCLGNTNLQGLIVDGTSAPEIINADYPYLLNQTMGARMDCRAYHEMNCPAGESAADNDEQFCVRLQPTDWSLFGVPSDLSGNWCPYPGNSGIDFNVLGVTATGVGNKNFVKIGSLHPTSFAQVINDRSGSTFNYRSVIEDFSYHLLTERGTSEGVSECVYGTPEADSAARVTAAYKEIERAIKWTLNISNPQALGLCAWWCDLTDVLDEDGASGAVTRLYQNRPNPFNPRTEIKFSLAADGPMKLVICDVNGRRVRTLVDRGLKAGMHQVVWDGTDDSGHAVSSGVYWTRLQAGDYTSNRKMVVLK